MGNLFEQGRNCQCLQEAHHAAFIVDGEAYFRALYESVRQARHSVFVVGWDLHSDLQLVRDAGDDDAPSHLGPLLDWCAARTEGPQIYLLSWDFAMIYAMEREFFPRYKLKWRTHRRIHFCLDGHHPVGASQHQKIVVVDDAVAFAGGLDASQWRWDTRDHSLEDPRRTDPGGKAYPPFHDIQMAVDGPAAAALGRVARQRWSCASEVTPVDPPRRVRETPWPQSITADLEHVRIAIARTLPAFKNQSAVREVEQLYLDSIAAARQFIYIENQYLSAYRVGQAIRKRLEEADGPEVVIVLPQKTGGWLEQHTMDVLRYRMMRRLRASDRHDRLRVCYPRLAQDPHRALMVHAKIMVVDDDLLCIGSANLSNRSMGLDSECNLAVGAEGDDTVRAAIARFRDGLLAEHLDTDMDTVSHAVGRHASLIQAIAQLGGGDRSLVPLENDLTPEIDAWVPGAELLDPEKPLEPDELFDYVVTPDQQPLVYRHLMKVVALIAGVLVLAALWRWTPLGGWVDVASVQAAAEWIRQRPMAPLVVMAAYVLGGFVAFPVTLMVIATVLVFGSGWGLIYALTGSAISALAVFWTGRLLGRDAVRRFAGGLLNRLSRRLSDAGLVAIIAFRIVPVAPFSVINLVAGVSEIRWRDFVLGTVLGMVPGVAAIVVLADRISASLRTPDAGRMAALGITVAAVGAGLAGLRRWVKQRRARRSVQNND